MMIFRSWLFLCVYVWLFCKQGFSSFYLEPLVMEGTSFSMNCTVNLSLNDWDIYWRLNDTGHISTCGLHYGCIEEKSGRFQAKMEMNDTLLISVLTIRQVSYEDRGQRFTCIALERNKEGTETLGGWNISRSYLPPDPPLTCQADLQEGQIIRVSCNAEKVYPEISCQPIQIFNDNEISLEIPMEYDKKSSNHHGYYSVNCSGIVFPYEEGAYKFCVNSTTAEQSNHPACTNTLAIKNQTTVRIAHDTITVNICPGEIHSMSIGCEILWWTSPEKPSVSCSVGDQVITNNSDVITTRHHTGQQYFSFESFCNFTLTLKDKGKSVKCDVTATNLTQVFSAAAKIDVSYHPPKFVYKGNEHTNRITFPVATNINVSVECTLEESNSESSVVTVECVGASMPQHFRLSQKHNSELHFLFSTDTNCTCKVENASPCVTNPAAKLIFVQDIRAVNSSWTCLGVQCLKYVIAAIAAGLCVVCMCVLYLVARRKHSNTPSNSCFRCFKLWQPVSLHDKDTVCSRNNAYNVTNLETSPYSVVDIVNSKSNLHEVSNLSDDSFLSKRRHYSNVPQKCHLPPKRKPLPSLPMSVSQHKTAKRSSDSSCFVFQDNEIDLRSSMDSIKMTAIESHCSLLPNEQIPPLPPRIKLKTKDQLPEIPCYIRDDLLRFEEALPNCQVNNDSVDRDTASCRSSNNSHSLPKRPLPPIPCGAKSQFINNVEDGLIKRHDTHTNHNCCEDRINHAIGETTEAVISARLQRLWPPPPIKARKQVVKKRHTNGKSKQRRQAAFKIITSNLNKHLKAPNDVKLDDSVNTYVNIKTQPPTANESTSETFDSDDCCNDEDDSNRSDRLDDSDTWSSLSCTGSSLSCSSASTVIEITRDFHSSQAESELL